MAMFFLQIFRTFCFYINKYFEENQLFSAVEKNLLSTCYLSKADEETQPKEVHIS